MGKKTSVYLTDQMQEKLASSGRSLPEVIRTGLGMTPSSAVPSRADLIAALREVVRESIAQDPAAQDSPDASPEQRLVGAIFGQDPGKVRDAPRLRAAPEPPPERPKLPTLDKRITQSADALVTEWSSALDNEPGPDLTLRVSAQVRLLLESGVVPADVGRGLTRWQASDSSAVPELIPEVVEQVMEAGE
jgi:hypothetical protein